MSPLPFAEDRTRLWIRISGDHSGEQMAQDGALAVERNF